MTLKFKKRISSVFIWLMLSAFATFHSWYQEIFFVLMFFTLVELLVAWARKEYQKN